MKNSLMFMVLKTFVCDRLFCNKRKHDKTNTETHTKVFFKIINNLRNSYDWPRDVRPLKSIFKIKSLI